MESMGSWKLCSFSQLLGLHTGVAALEYGAQFAVERLDAGLEQQVSTTFAPLHLLAFAEPFADDVVHR
jgi:hypothetical protein